MSGCGLRSLDTPSTSVLIYLYNIPTFPLGSSVLHLLTANPLVHSIPSENISTPPRAYLAAITSELDPPTFRI